MLLCSSVWFFLKMWCFFNHVSGPLQRCDVFTWGSFLPQKCDVFFAYVSGLLPKMWCFLWVWSSRYVIWCFFTHASRLSKGVMFINSCVWPFPNIWCSFTLAFVHLKMFLVSWTVASECRSLLCVFQDFLFYTEIHYVIHLYPLFCSIKEIL